MKTIKTIIIDDEQGSRLLLKNYLNKYCADIEVMREAGSADEAFEVISQNKPDLIFLDIRMPEKNGFELLRMFKAIDFDVIFVSGFDEYAIQAFDFNAIAYILKPLDYQKLIAAVEKAKGRIEQKNHQSGNLLHFVRSIDEKNELVKKISLHHNDKVCLIDVKNITHIEAMRGYCKIATSDRQTYISAKPLKEYEKLFSGMNFFYKANKSILINVFHVFNYSKGISCFITLTDEKTVEVSRRRKTEIVEIIKNAQ